jgi:thiamine-monophosphate kinase
MSSRSSSPNHEESFLNWLRAQKSYGAGTQMVRVGIGDDLAILDWAPGLLLAGVDQCLDGVHVDSKIHSPRAIGIKATNRSLSDCAAMGCRPVAVLIAAALPIGCGLDYAKELYLGAEAACSPHGCAIVGGDTASWPHPLAVSVTVLGKSAAGGPTLRRTVQPGDRLYVSGPLGGSILGRHMTFAPRIDLGVRLAETGAVHAMMDLSDGLSRDLPRLLGLLGAIIDAGAVPIHPDAEQLSRQDGRSALEHALHDGEDYELLLACPAPPLPGLIEIGTVTASPGGFLQSASGRTPLEPLGWQHRL